MKIAKIKLQIKLMNVEGSFMQFFMMVIMKICFTYERSVLVLITFAKLHDIMCTVRRYIMAQIFYVPHGITTIYVQN